MGTEGTLVEMPMVHGVGMRGAGGDPILFFLFELKMEYFGAVFKLDLSEENCLNLLSKYNKNAILQEEANYPLLPHTVYAYGNLLGLHLPCFDVLLF